MDWKTRHTVATILFTIVWTASTVGEGGVYRLMGALLGAGVASVILVWATSALVQWVVRKYRDRGDGGGDPPAAKPAD